MSRETEEIKQRLDIVEIIGGYIPLKKAGANHKGACPFHQEKSPSFMVSQSKQIWHCFGCHEGGDIFSFVQRIEGIDFYESLKILADKAGVKIEKKSGVKSDKKDRLLEILDLSAKFFNKVLLKHPKAEIAREYFKERQLKDETVEKFLLGYSPDSWDTLLKFLISRKFSQADIIDAGLVVYNQEKNSIYDRFRGRIMIPLRDSYGNIVGFTARALGDDYQGGKYINTPQTQVYDKSRVAFGLYHAKQAIKEKDYAVIVEGNMDVISSHQAEVLPVIAVSGTALTEAQLGLIKRFTKTCVFAFDADNAGLMAARRGVELALEAGLNVKVLTLPSGKDPDDCIKEGVHLWEKAIADAQPVMDYLIDMGVKNYDVTNPEGKKSLSSDVVSLLKFFPNPVERDHYIQKLSNVLSVSPYSITELLQQQSKAAAQVKTTATKQNVEVKAENPVKKKASPHEEASRGYLALLIKNPRLSHEDSLNDAYLSGQGVTELYKSLKIFYDNLDDQSEGILNITKFSEDLSSDLQTLLTHLQLYADKEFNDFSSQQSREAFQARKKFLQRHYLKRQLQLIQKSLIEAESRNDKVGIEKLSIEFSQVSRNLAELQ